MSFLRKNWLILLILLSGQSYAITSVQQYLILPNTPRQISLGGSSAAYPRDSATMLTTPTALSSVTYNSGRTPASIYLATQPLLFDYRNNSGFANFPVFGLDFGAYFQSVTSQPFDAINDFGQTTATLNESFFAGGLGASKKFRLKRDILIAGANVKVYNSQLATFSTTGFLADVGVNYYFNTPRSKFLPYISQLPNTSVALTLRNIGPAVKFANDSVPAPFTYEASVRYGLYARRIHDLDFYSSFSQNTTFSNVNVGFGFEYHLMRFIVVRAGGISSSLQGFNFSGGMGLSSRVGKRFNYKLDYALQMLQADSSQANHAFGLGASYNFHSMEKVKVNRQFDLEVVAEVKRFVQSIDRKRANPPDNINDVYDEMEKAGYPRPTLTNGRLIYVSELKEVVYIRKARLDDPNAIEKSMDVIQLKDGSLIVGTVLSKDIDGLVIQSDIGKTTIPFDQIARIESRDLNQVDDQVRDRVQALVNQFKTDKGRFPNDLEELEIYAKETVQVFPKPVQKKLTYDKNTGQVSVF